MGLIEDALSAPRKARERRRLRDRQVETRVAAFRGALELCEAAGPEAIRTEYGIPAATDADIADAYAAAAYNDEVATMAASGALEGFRRHRARL